MSDTMEPKLFDEYQAIIGRLERLIEQTSVDEVIELLDYDIRNWEADE